MNKSSTQGMARETKKWYDSMFGAFMFTSLHAVERIVDQHLSATKKYLQEVTKMTGSKKCEHSQVRQVTND